MKINVKIFESRLLVLLILLLTLFSSCNLDQVDSKYSDFESADNDGFFTKGWIPSGIVFKSMTNIYLRSNLDVNTCVFNYNLSETDIEKLKLRVTPTKIKFKELRSINTPSHWNKSINSLNCYVYESNLVYLAIDEENNIIYGWSN